jgi:hypothetical protein
MSVRSWIVPKITNLTAECHRLSSCCRAGDQATLTARPHWAPPVPLTAGGGVAYSPPRGAAAVPRPAQASGPRVEVRGQ